MLADLSADLFTHVCCAFGDFAVGEDGLEAVHGRHEHFQEPAVAVAFAVGALPPCFKSGVGFPGLEFR